MERLGVDGSSHEWLYRSTLKSKSSNTSGHSAIRRRRIDAVLVRPLNHNEAVAFITPISPGYAYLTTLGVKVKLGQLRIYLYSDVDREQFGARRVQTC